MVPPTVSNTGKLVTLASFVLLANWKVPPTWVSFGAVTFVRPLQLTKDRDCPTSVRFGKDTVSNVFCTKVMELLIVDRDGKLIPLTLCIVILLAQIRLENEALRSCPLSEILNILETFANATSIFFRNLLLLMLKVSTVTTLMPWREAKNVSETMTSDAIVICLVN